MSDNSDLVVFGAISLGVAFLILKPKQIFGEASTPVEDVGADLPGDVIEEPTEEPIPGDETTQNVLPIIAIL